MQQVCSWAQGSAFLTSSHMTAMLLVPRARCTARLFNKMDKWGGSGLLSVCVYICLSVLVRSRKFRGKLCVCIDIHTITHPVYRIVGRIYTTYKSPSVLLSKSLEAESPLMGDFLSPTSVPEASPCPSTAPHFRPPRLLTMLAHQPQMLRTDLPTCQVPQPLRCESRSYPLAGCRFLSL